jgi:hypothetical protein
MNSEDVFKFVRSELHDRLIRSAINRWSNLQPGESPRDSLTSEELQSGVGVYGNKPKHVEDFHEGVAVLTGRKGATVVSSDFFHENNQLAQRLQAKLLAAGAKIRPVAGGLSITKSPHAKKYNRNKDHHPLVAGFRIAHALEYLIQDPKATDTLKSLAASVLYNGDTNALTPLADHIREQPAYEGDVHPLANEYNWENAAAKLHIDAAVQVAIDAVAKTVPGYVENFPDRDVTTLHHNIIRSLKHVNKQRHFPFDHYADAEKEAIDELQKHLTKEEIAESLDRHWLRLSDVRDSRGSHSAHDYIINKDEALNPTKTVESYTKDGLSSSARLRKASQYARKIVESKEGRFLVHNNPNLRKKVVWSGLTPTTKEGETLRVVHYVLAKKLESKKQHPWQWQMSSNLFPEEPIFKTENFKPGYHDKLEGINNVNRHPQNQDAIELDHQKHEAEEGNEDFHGTEESEHFGRIGIDKASNELTEAYNKQFRDLADRLHAKHGVGDLESFKANPFQKLLIASNGNLDTASDVANHLLYEGVIERRHKPGQNLKTFLSGNFVRLNKDEATGDRREKQRGTKLFTDIQHLFPEQATVDFAEDKAVRGFTKAETPSAVKKAQADKNRKTFLTKMNNLSIEELGNKLLTILKDKPGSTATELAKGKLRVPVAKIMEAANKVGVKQVVTPPPKRGGQKSTKLYHPDHYSRSKPGADFLSALRRLRSGVQEALRKVADSIHRKLKVTPAETIDTIHDRVEASTVNTIQQIQHNDPKKARVAAAWYGLQTQSPSLVVFFPGEGTDLIHKLQVTGSGEGIRIALNNHGLHQRLITPNKTGFEITLFDRNGKNLQLVKKFALTHGSPVKSIQGNGEVIGKGKDITADDKARANYRSIIRKYEQEQLNANTQPAANSSPNYVNAGAAVPTAATAAPNAAAPAFANAYGTAQYKRA